MNKKILLAVVLAGTIGNQAHAAHTHSGFSIGATLGYANVTGSFNRSFVPTGAFATGGDTSNIGSSAPLFGAFLGYGWSPNPVGLYLGGEIFGQFQNLNPKLNNDNGSVVDVRFATQIRTSNTFGAVGKIGYLCKEALFFLKIGLASAKWQFKFQDNGAAPNFGTASTNSRKTGFVAGLGMDYAIAKNWAIGTEYTYTAYGAIKLPITTLGTFTYKPRVHAFNVRLKYTF